MQLNDHAVPFADALERIRDLDHPTARVLLGVAREKDGEAELVILHPTRSVRKVFDISIPGGVPGLEIRN